MKRLPQGVRLRGRAFLAKSAIFDYRLRITEHEGFVREIDDPYRYGQVMGELDLHLLGEGTHYRAFEKLGSHPLTIGDSTGMYFAVWAPNADRVSVVGDFNRWNGLAHPMRRLVPNGIWELFVPGLGAGRALQVRDPSALREAADSEERSLRAPVRDAAGHGVADERARAATRGATTHGCRSASCPTAAWTSRSRSTRCTPPPGTRVREDGHRSLTYRELAERLVPYVKDMGFTHIELLPMLEHPVRRIRGAIRSRGSSRPPAGFGTPDDFKCFVDECHRHGIGVILDWVPGHFPKDAHGLARFDGTALYEHEDPRHGRASGLGHADLQLRPQRGAQLPRQQRALLDRGVPPRRPARRRRRVDALSRLLARPKASGSRTATAGARTSTPCRSSGT